MEKINNNIKPRIFFLDFVRGICIILMVAFHAFFTIGYIFDFSWAMRLFDFFDPIEPIFAGIFIFLAGISCNLSHSNLSRGLKLGLISAFVTLVTFFLDYYIFSGIVVWFGILHLLAFSIIIYGISLKLIKKINPFIGFILSALIFSFTYNINDGYVGFFSFSYHFSSLALKNPLLYPIGISANMCDSGDCFTIFPWFFLFLCGVFIFKIIKKLPQFFYQKRNQKLCFLGRKSLIIYIVHQPIIFGIIWIIAKIMGRQIL